MALDDEDPAARVDRQARGRDDLGLRRDLFQHEPRVERAGWRGDVSSRYTKVSTAATQRPRSIMAGFSGSVWRRVVT